MYLGDVDRPTPDQFPGLTHNPTTLHHTTPQGVNIYVLLPSPPPTTPDPDPDTSNPAAGLNPRYTQTRLLGLPHAPGRIHVLLAAAPLGASGAQAWTHHDNLLIVDQELAFIGSTTLGLGQWDTAHHLLKDDTVHSGGQGGLRASRRLVQPAARPYSLSSHPTQQAAKVQIYNVLHVYVCVCHIRHATLPTTSSTN